MSAVARLVGTDARLKLAGTAWGKFRNLEFNPRMELIKARAAGDLIMVNVGGWQDFELRGTSICDDTEPYPTAAAFGALGSSVAWIALAKSGHVNGFVSGEGIISETPVRIPHDDVVELSVVIAPNGNVPTYDPTPST